MGEVIRDNASTFFLALSTLVTAAIISGSGFIWSANRQLAVIVNREDTIQQTQVDIENRLAGYETKNHAKEIYQRIWHTDQDQYKKIDAVTRTARKLGQRVQALEDRARYRGGH